MDFKDFILGEKYNISALAIEGSFAGKKYAVFKLPTGRTFLLRAEDFEAVSPARQDVRSEHSTVGTLSPAERLDRLWNGMGDVLFPNGTKNTETAPKYDPCRRFRKGDIVTPKERNGRAPWGQGMKLTVVADESTAGVTVRDEETEEERLMCVLFLELVTPVEEQEPYYVKNIIRGYAVYERGAGDLSASCVFWSKYHPHAKAAAEAERDRLNAEYRKETK